MSPAGLSFTAYDPSGIGALSRPTADPGNVPCSAVGTVDHWLSNSLKWASMDRLSVATMRRRSSRDICSISVPLVIGFGFSGPCS